MSKYLEKHDLSVAIKIANLHENCRLGLSLCMWDNEKVQHPSLSLAPA
jgi:hypothetical protein